MISYILLHSSFKLKDELYKKKTSSYGSQVKTMFSNFLHFHTTKLSKRNKSSSMDLISQRSSDFCFPVRDSFIFHRDNLKILHRSLSAIARNLHRDRVIQNKTFGTSHYLLRNSSYGHFNHKRSKLLHSSKMKDGG